MKSYSYFQITIISIILISYVYNVNCFSTDNPILRQISNRYQNEPKSEVTNLSDSENKRQERRELNDKRTDLSPIVSNLKPQSNAEPLPNPQAASAAKTVKKVLGFTVTVFVVLLLIAIFAICGCVFLMVRICCS